MERYSEYQDTGIAWMPQIPSHWKYLQFRGLFSITKRIAGRKGLDVLAVTQRGIKVKDVESNEGQIAADYSNYQIVEPGDFAMNHMDLLTGFIGISPQYGVTSPDYRVFKNTSPLANSRYYLYLFELCYKQRIFYGLGHGVSNKGRWRLPAPVQNRFNIPLPSLAEQEKIVSYLDSKTSKIDAYVADKEKEIRLLQELKQKTIAEAVTKGLNPNVKMKDCGISWIGMIPEHWEVKRAKYMFLKNKRERRPEDEVITCFRDGQVTLRKNRRLTGFTESEKYDGYQGIRKGDLVIHQMDAFAGSIGVSDSDGMGTSVYHCCTPIGDYNVYYYAFLIRQMAMSGFIQSLYKGIRERSSDFSFSVFGNQFLAVPPRTEQNAIVTYIEEKCQKVDTLITELQAEIDNLKEYKQRLIADVVTGQVNVQNL